MTKNKTAEAVPEAPNNPSKPTTTNGKKTWAEKRLEAALAYAKRGLLVLPLHTPDKEGHCSCSNPQCESIGKHPRTPHGLKDATTDRQTIKDWWKQWPSANVGIVTGAVSGLLVFDIDPRHGGDESLKELEDQYGKLPRSTVVETGSGGFHIYLKHPGGKIKSTTGFRPGIDIRADGAYVVAPPSFHKDQKHYRWRQSE